jgi:general stress protein 13
VKEMKYNVNDVIYVTIASVTPYGAFVNADYGYTGLIHISEITGKYIKDITKYFKIGNIIEVTVIGIDEEKKQLSLSTKGIMPSQDIQNELVEDEIGFENLMEKLPEWIDETKKELENADN